MDTKERAKRWSSGDGYDRYINSELNSFRKAAWKKQIGEHLDGRKGLDVLDAGTGPGFFACILSEEGQKVTAIDSSEGMLERAENNAELLGVYPVFIKMDVNKLAFEDDSFDAIVTRNVTWTLEHPELVYTEFRRILRPGGILLIYDANWHLHFFDEKKMRRVRERERRHLEKYGTPEIVAGDDMEYYATAPLTSTLRPDWDREVLSRLGFDISIHEDIGQQVYKQWEKDLYAESPLFEVCAVKRRIDPAEASMKEYWQKRASSFGYSKDLQIFERLGSVVQRHLPEGRLKVLDVGTGTGVIATSLALLGHDVTGVDLCSNMIAKAKENTAAMGLDVNFVCTSAGELPFADNSFDVVISRNLLWALPEPESTLKQWRRVLKPDGLLIYWDGNHYFYQYDEQAAKDREKMRQLCGSVHGKEADSGVDYSLCDNTSRELPLSRFDRPSQWDEIVLPKLGFDIFVEEIHKPQALLKYGIADGYYTNFLLFARNAKAAV